MLRAALAITALAALPACSGTLQLSPSEAASAVSHPKAGVVDVDGEPHQVPRTFTLEIIPNEHGGRTPALGIAQTIQYPLKEPFLLEHPVFAAVGYGALVVRDRSDRTTYAVPLGEIRRVELSWGKADRNGAIVFGVVIGVVVAGVVVATLARSGVLHGPPPP